MNVDNRNPVYFQSIYRLSDEGADRYIITRSRRRQSPFEGVFFKGAGGIDGTRGIGPPSQRDTAISSLNFGGPRLFS